MKPIVLMSTVALVIGVASMGGPKRAKSAPSLQSFLDRRGRGPIECFFDLLVRVRQRKPDDTKLGDVDVKVTRERGTCRLVPCGPLLQPRVRDGEYANDEDTHRERPRQSPEPAFQMEASSSPQWHAWLGASRSAVWRPPISNIPWRILRDPTGVRDIQRRGGA